MKVKIFKSYCVKLLCYHLSFFIIFACVMSWFVSFVIFWHLPALASANSLEVFHFPTPGTALAICWAPLLFMNISTVLQLIHASLLLAFNLFSALFFCSCLFTVLNYLPTFVASSKVFCAHWASILLALAYACSLVNSFVILIVLSSLMISVIILSSYMPCMNCSCYILSFFIIPAFICFYFESAHPFLSIFVLFLHYFTVL